MKSRWTRSSWLSRPEGTKCRAGSREAVWFHCRVPAGGGGGEGGTAGEKTKLNLERLAGSSGLQSPCLEGGWRRHSGGSMAPGSLDWLHQTLEGEALLKIQGFWESKKKKAHCGPLSFHFSLSSVPTVLGPGPGQAQDQESILWGSDKPGRQSNLQYQRVPRERAELDLPTVKRVLNKPTHLHWASSQFVCMCLCPIARYEQDAKDHQIMRNVSGCKSETQADKLRKQTWGNLCRKKLSWKRTINIIFRVIKKSLSFRNTYLFIICTSIHTFLERRYR